MKGFNKSITFKYKTLLLLIIYLTSCYSLSLIENNKVLAYNSFMQKTPESDEIKPSQEETSTTQEETTQEETTTEIIAPTPPITYDPSKESTQTSQQTSEDSTKENIEVTTPTSNEQDPQETSDNESTVSSQASNESSEKINEVPKNNRKKPFKAPIEAGKLVVIRKDAFPLELLLSELALQLNNRPDLIHDLYYQLTFITRHVLIFPEADIMTIIDRQLLQWIDLFFQFSN